MIKEENLKKIVAILKTIPKKWDGKSTTIMSLRKMRDRGEIKFKKRRGNVLLQSIKWKNKK